MKNTVLFLVGCVAFVWGCYALSSGFEMTPPNEKGEAWKINRFSGETWLCSHEFTLACIRVR